MASESSQRHSLRAWIGAGALALVIASAAGGFAYWKTTSSRIYVDAATIEAPQIGLAPTVAGTLQEVYVHVGDEVAKNQPVARVDNELVKTNTSGIIVSVVDSVGSKATPGTPVVTMVDPSQLRVVGKVDEDKGLSKIAVGESVTFTVDATGGKKYSAVIDEVSPTSEQSGIVFNISDKRETRQFEVKARYDIESAPQLHNGMSARMWIYIR